MSSASLSGSFRARRSRLITFKDREGKEVRLMELEREEGGRVMEVDKAREKGNKRGQWGLLSVVEEKRSGGKFERGGGGVFRNKEGISERRNEEALM